MQDAITWRSQLWGSSTVCHARRIGLAAELLDAAHHIDQIPAAALKTMLEATAKVLGALFKRMRRKEARPA